MHIILVFFPAPLGPGIHRTIINLLISNIFDSKQISHQKTSNEENRVVHTISLSRQLAPHDNRVWTVPEDDIYQPREPFNLFNNYFASQ